MPHSVRQPWISLQAKAADELSTEDDALNADNRGIAAACSCLADVSANMRVV